MSAAYEGMMSWMKESMTAPDESKRASVEKSKRPLKMPKNYDFSVRNVNWN